jgi:hypothetical protein
MKTERVVPDVRRTIAWWSAGAASATAASHRSRFKPVTRCYSSAPQRYVASTAPRPCR